MINILKFLAVFSLLIFSYKSQASAFFFEASNGKEVEVRLFKGGGKWTFAIMNDVGISHNQLVHEMISTAYEREHYRYIQTETPPCSDCFIESNPLRGFSDSRFSSEESHYVENTRSKSRIEKVEDASIQNAVQTAFNEGVDAIKRAFANPPADSKLSEMPLFSVQYQNGKPLQILDCHQGICISVPEVTFTSFENGFGITYPVVDPTNKDTEQFRLRIQLTVSGIVGRAQNGVSLAGSKLGAGSYSCRIAYTGSGESLTAQIVCYRE